MKGIFANRNIISVVALKIWGVIAGFLIIIALPTYFSKEELGYYYLFQSIIAIQGILELGLLTITQNSISRFYFGSNLIALKKGSRFARLKIGVNSYFSAATLVFFIIINGLFIISTMNSNNDSGIYYAWVIFSIATCINFIMLQNYAVIEGLGNFSTSTYIKLISSIASVIVLILCVYMGVGLLSAGISQLTTLIVSIFLFLKFKINFVNLKFDFKYIYIFIKKNYQFQKNMCITMISGYFIFTLYVPFIFKNYGPVFAGQVGLVISIFGFLLSVSNSFMQTSIPNLINLISCKKWNEAKNTFKKNFIYSMIFSLFACILLYIFISLLKYTNLTSSYITKFPSSFIFLVLSLHFLANAFCANISIYLRAKNKEIFAKENMIMALITVSMLFLLRDIPFYLYIAIIPLLFVVLFPIMYYRKFIIEQDLNA